MFATVIFAAAAATASAQTPPPQTQAPPPAQAQTPPPGQAPPAPTPPEPAQQGAHTIIQRILVKVNGQIFTETELEDMQIQALRDKNMQVNAPQDLQNDAVLKQTLSELTPDLLVDAVDNLLLVQRAHELNIQFTDDMFKGAVENIKKQNNLDDDGLKKAMSQMGLTMQQLRGQLEEAYLKQQVTQHEIGQHMTITEEEAHQYYQAHQSEFMNASTVMLRQIFVAVPTQTQGTQSVFNAATDEAAKTKIQAARERALKGEDFEKIVADVSESPTKDTDKGLIGPVNIADLDPSLRAVIEKMKPGDLSDAIRTARGYQLFKLESVTPASVKPFDVVRDDINQKIFQSRLDGETRKLLTTLRNQALIEWEDDGYRQMYEKRLSERLAAAGKS
jgi:peptidyl-prolyl cis-trans isomerase SurA